jgi:protein-tyrosine-phosphatase
MEPLHRRTILTTFGPRQTPILLLGDLDPDPWAPPSIADPYGGSAEVFAGTYARIDRCIEELARRIELQHLT